MGKFLTGSCLVLCASAKNNPMLRRHGSRYRTATVARLNMRAYDVLIYKYIRLTCVLESGPPLKTYLSLLRNHHNVGNDNAWEWFMPCAVGNSASHNQGIKINEISLNDTLAHLLWDRR